MRLRVLSVSLIWFALLFAAISWVPRLREHQWLDAERQEFQRAVDNAVSELIAGPERFVFPAEGTSSGSNSGFQSDENVNSAGDLQSSTSNQLESQFDSNRFQRLIRSIETRRFLQVSSEPIDSAAQRSEVPRPEGYQFSGGFVNFFGRRELGGKAFLFRRTLEAPAFSSAAETILWVTIGLVGWGHACLAIWPVRSFLKDANAIFQALPVVLSERPLDGESMKGRLAEAFEPVAAIDQSFGLRNTSQLATALRATQHVLLERLSETSSLRFQNDRTYDLLSQLREGIISLNPELEIEVVNEAAQRFLAIQESPNIQSNTESRKLVEMVRIPEVLDIAKRTLQLQSPQRCDLVQPSVNRFLRISGLPLPHPMGKGVLLTIADVSDSVRAENMRREFTTSVSHELKTPLAAIRAFSETLLLGAIDDPDNNRRFVERIEEQSERLEGLVNDLLELSRIQSAANLDFETFSISDLFGTLSKAWKEIAITKSIAIEQTIECPDELLESNRYAISTILNNLLSNAIRYSPNGSTITMRASVGTELDLQQLEQEKSLASNTSAASMNTAPENLSNPDPSASNAISKEQDKPEHADSIEHPTFIVLSIADQGIGIHKEDQERIFERFFRVDRARTSNPNLAVGGSGLGLSIVRNLARAIGARTMVESKVGSGSIFSLWIPRKKTPTSSQSH